VGGEQRSQSGGTTNCYDEGNLTQMIIYKLNRSYIRMTCCLLVLHQHIH
jgi:hypothetical protein